MSNHERGDPRSRALEWLSGLAAERPSLLRVPRWFALLVPVAFLLRALLWWQYCQSPFSQVTVGDERHYWRWAAEIAAGKWLPDDVFYQGPLFPYALALLKLLVPSLGQAGLAALQLCLNGVTALLLLPLVRRWAQERVALAAAAMALLFAPGAFFALKGVPLTLGLLLLVLGLLALPTTQRAWKVRCAAAGALCALGVLAVPATILVLGSAALFLLLRPQGRPRFLPAATYLLAALLTVLPVTVSNYLQDGSLVLVATDYGVVFLQGNNPLASGGYTQLPRVSPWVGDEKRDTMRWARRETGQPLNTQGMNRFLLAQGWRFIRENPGRWLLLVGRKAMLLLGGADVPHEFTLTRERRDFLPWLWAFPVGGTLILVLSALALWDADARRGLLLPLTAASALGLTSLLFYVANRHVCPFQFLLLPPAAAGLVALPRLLRRFRRFAVVLPVVVAAIASRSALSSTYWEAEDYLAKLVVVYGELKNLPMVTDTLERIFAVAPDSPASFTLLGDVYRVHGEPENALLAYSHALDLSPGNRRSLLRRAALLGELRHREEAIADLEAVLEKDPEDEEALAALQELRALQGEAGP